MARLDPDSQVHRSPGFDIVPGPMNSPGRRTSAMMTATRLLFGPLAGATFFVGVLSLAQFVPDYSQVHQSISEIGEVGSPTRIPFAAMQFSYAICLLIFASGIRGAAIKVQRSPLAA